ncbi:MAG: hypothetical protein WBA10_15625 [Elainellaceae cyanobacterium]
MLDFGKLMYGYRIMANLAQSQSSSVAISSKASGASLGYASEQAVGFTLRLLGLILLLLLVVVASVVWIWIYSFRSGWQLFDWMKQSEGSSSDIAASLVYGLIVLFVSPIVLFADWLQALLKQRLGIDFPPETNLREIVEEQLGTTLGDNFPFFRDSLSPNKKDSAL